MIFGISVYIAHMHSVAIPIANPTQSKPRV
jgi:hypothetical protein